MSSFYYLISSLPELTLGEAPSIDINELHRISEEFLSSQQMEELKKIQLIPYKDSQNKSKLPVIEDWKNWEICLRNRAVKVRSGQLRKDSENFLREENDVSCETDKAIQEAYSSLDPKEKEMKLDDLRLKALEDLSVGHHFDLTKLCIYKLKLLICYKWVPRTRNKGTKNFEYCLSHLYKS